MLGWRNRKMNKEALMTRKLTKKFHSELKVGVYLVSNIAFAPDDPCFAEAVCPKSTRDVQWERILNAGAEQRLCRVFRDYGHYYEWLNGT
jgi:hypothetical protein